MNNDTISKNKFLNTFFIILLFSFLALIFTFPLIFYLGSGLVDLGDSSLNSWILAWDVHQIFSDPLNLFEANIFAPFKNTLAYSENMIGTALLAFPIIKIFHNPILAHNIMVLLSFIISGWGMYLLVHYLTQNSFASFIASIIFTFAPYKIAQTELHLQMLISQWIPFIFLYLHKYLETKFLKYLLLAGLFFILQAWSNLHYGLFTALALLIFVSLYLIYHRYLFKRQVIYHFIIFFIISLLFIAPLLLPYWQFKHEMNFKRNLEEIDPHSPSIINYLATPALSFLFTDPERIVFPGIITIFLLIFSLEFISKLKDFNKLNILKIYFWLGIVFFFLSLGPWIHFTRMKGEISLPGPYLFFYYFIPGFDGIRSTGRMSIFVLFALSIIIGFGLKFIFKKLPLKKHTLGIIIILSALVFEFRSMPLSFYRTLPTGKKIPVVYLWLAQQKEDFTLLELPMNDYWINAQYMYYSTYHWKKLVNGHSGYYPPGYAKLAWATENLPLTNVIPELKEKNVKYIIFHFDKYDDPVLRKKMIQSASQEEDLKIVTNFDSDYVYEIGK